MSNNTAAIAYNIACYEHYHAFSQSSHYPLSSHPPIHAVLGFIDCSVSPAAVWAWLAINSSSIPSLQTLTPNKSMT